MSDKETPVYYERSNNSSPNFENDKKNTGGTGKGILIIIALIIGIVVLDSNNTESGEKGTAIEAESIVYEEGDTVNVLDPEETLEELTLEEQTSKKSNMNEEITIEEFREVFYSYSSLPWEIETIEEEQIYIEEKFNEWKSDPEHWGWKQNEDGKWLYDEPIELSTIVEMAVSGTCKDFLRYEDYYNNRFVILDVRVRTSRDEVEYISQEAVYYSEVDYYGTNGGNEMIIQDKRYDRGFKWLEGDYIRIYGKMKKVEKRNFTHSLSGESFEMDIPIIEVYYSDLLQE